MQLVLGVGCDRGISLQTLEQAVALALQSVSSTLEHVSLMATIDQKSDELAILALAKQQRWRLQFYPTALLAQANVPVVSVPVTRYMATACVSQAAALLAANATSEELLVSEYKYRGIDGKSATVSVARLSE